MLDLKIIYNGTADKFTKESTSLQLKLVFQPQQKHSQNRCFLEDIPGLREREIFPIFTG